MAGMAFYTSTNSLRWRKGKLIPGGDAKWVFIPEAESFAEEWFSTALVPINCRRTRGKKEYLRFVKVKDQLSRQPSLSHHHISFYGHGWPTRMQHFLNLDNLGEFAAELNRVLKPKGQIFFNSCSMARGPRSPKGGRYNGDPLMPWERCAGSYADRLRKALVDRGRPDISVYAHYTSGHATQNPHVIKNGDSWVVPPAAWIDKRHYKRAGNLDQWYKNRADWLAWVSTLKTNSLKTALEMIHK